MVDNDEGDSGGPYRRSRDFPRPPRDHMGPCGDFALGLFGHLKPAGLRNPAWRFALHRPAHGGTRRLCHWVHSCMDSKYLLGSLSGSPVVGIASRDPILVCSQSSWKKWI